MEENQEGLSCRADPTILQDLQPLVENSSSVNKVMTIIDLHSQVSN